MAKKSEREVLDEVLQRAVGEFSQLPPGVVAAVVEDTWMDFSHSVIRDYIPLLVERRAHKQLALLAANPNRSLQLTPTA